MAKKKPSGSGANNSGGAGGEVGARTTSAALESDVAAIRSELAGLRAAVAEARDKTADGLRTELESLRRQASEEVLRTIAGNTLDARLAEIEARLDARAGRVRQHLDALVDAIDAETERYLGTVRSLPAGGIEAQEQRLAGYRDQLEKAQAELLAFHSQTIELEQKLADRDAEIHRLRRDEGRVLLDEALEQQREVEARLAELEAVEQLRLENARLVAHLEKLRTLEQADTHAFAQEAELEQTLRELSRLSGEHHALSREHENLGRLYDAARRERNALFKEVRELQEERLRREARDQHLAEVEALVGTWQQRFEEADRERRNFAAACAEARNLELRAEQARLDAERRAADAETGARRAMDAEFAQRVASLRQEMELATRNEVEVRVADIRQAYERLKASHAQAEGRAADLQRALDAALADVAGLQARERERVAAWYLEKEGLARDHLASLQKEREEQLWALATERASLADEVTLLEGRVGRLSEDEENLEERLASLRAELASLAGSKGELERKIETLEQRDHELRHIDLPRKERLADVRRPIVAQRPLKGGDAPGEAEWLSQVADRIAESGFEFPPRILRAFHTSLKCADLAPITVLAGISGTGKSQLPRLYADHGGLHFLNMPVQPSWDSPEDLFGFFDQTNGRYRSTPIVSALHQAVGDAAAASLQDRVLMVLLDEMNIARVEHYFSELLSKLETRRGLQRNDDEWQRAAIRLDCGAGQEPEWLFLDHNVLFVGTMNEDESTLSLTDKVKDRASIISFPSPRDFHDRPQRRVPLREHALQREVWERWCRADQLSADEQKLLHARVTGFNEALGHVGQAVGHRVFQAVRRYVSLYPRLDGAQTAFEQALSDAYAQKLLPKLVGIECGSSRGKLCLDRVYRDLPEDLREAFARARTDDYFTWSGSRALFEQADEREAN